MKKQFYEFYNLPDERVLEIWDKGILVLDTNVLLDLYRLGLKARSDLQKSIEFFKDRLWIPYQVGLEFHRNRERVIANLGKQKFDEFNEIVEKVVRQSKEAFKDYHRHPCIDYEYIEKAFEKLKTDLERRCDRWRKAYPFNKEDDDILEWVSNIFEGKTGDDYPLEKLLTIYKEGEVRYKAMVPPGFKDITPEKRDAGSRYVYGDLIIWKSVIEKAKKDEVCIIFITNDNKEDWYEREKGNSNGPRFELIREFHKETGQDIIIMSEANFLRHIKEKLSVNVKDSSIQDAEQALKPINVNLWTSIVPNLGYIDLSRPFGYSHQDLSVMQSENSDLFAPRFKTITELLAEYQKTDPYGLLYGYNDSPKSE